MRLQLQYWYILSTWRPWEVNSNRSQCQYFEILSRHKPELGIETATVTNMLRF